MINLCFHGIGTPERELEADEDQFWVEPDRFEALLDAATSGERHGIGLARARLWDTAGLVGRSLQTLLLEPRADR